MKTCTKCGVTKPVSEFSKRSAARDGLRSQCKRCDSAGSAAWNAANPERYRKNHAKWRSANLSKLREKTAKWRIANPDKSREAIARWHKANPDCRRESSAKWKAANPEAVRTGTHNRRARKRANGGILSKNLSERLFKLQRGKCACCGLPLGDDYHLDHIMPLALGGSNTDDNIQLLRAICNMKKNAKHPVEFMQERGFLL